MTKKMINLLTLFSIFQIILFSLSIMGYFSLSSMYFDIVSHFKLQYLLFSIVFLLFFIYAKNMKMIALAIFVIFINFIEMKDYIINIKDPINNDDKSIIMSYNVLGSNSNYNALIKLVEKEKPDVLVLQEVNEKWDSNLNELYKKYKNVYKKIKSDNFGIVFLTNYDVVSTNIIYYDPNVNIPSIKVELLINNNEYHIIGTHPLNPSNTKAFKSRNISLLNMVDNDLDKNKLIIIGDLNTSMWSNTYKEFSSLGKLKNTRIGFGIHNSWSTINYMFLFNIPIDHIMVNENITVNNFRVLENIGSDHYPILAELELN
jgi:endonuclease/exonuclease/phosphatase (EEP) superfamily protein YafD